MRAGFDLVILNENKLSNLSQRKADGLRLLDEAQLFDVIAAVETKSARAADRLRQKSFLLIKADRVNCQAGLPRHLPDLEIVRHPHLQPYTLEPTLESSSLFQSESNLFAA